MDADWETSGAVRRKKSLKTDASQNTLAKCENMYLLFSTPVFLEMQSRIMVRCQPLVDRRFRLARVSGRISLFLFFKSGPIVSLRPGPRDLILLGSHEWIHEAFMSNCANLSSTASNSG